MSEIVELRKKMEEKRCELHTVVNGNFNRLLDQETYDLSVELDKLIVRIMKKEMEIKRNVN